MPAKYQLVFFAMLKINYLNARVSRRDGKTRATKFTGNEKMKEKEEEHLVEN